MLTITGNQVKIWASEFEGEYGKYRTYSISIGKKREDGSWTNARQAVRFKKGVELHNGDVIHIRNAFPTVLERKDEKNTVIWMITEFDMEDLPDTPPAPKYTAVSEDDIPF